MVIVYLYEYIPKIKLAKLIILVGLIYYHSVQLASQPRSFQTHVYYVNVYIVAITFYVTSFTKLRIGYRLIENHMQHMHVLFYMY